MQDIKIKDQTPHCSKHVLPLVVGSLTITCEDNMELMKIFFQSFLQIGLVAVNTLLISKQLFLGVFICSSAISLLWAFNVSKIALSDLRQKLIYALGAGTGAITGLFLVKCFL